MNASYLIHLLTGLLLVLALGASAKDARGQDGTKQRSNRSQGDEKKPRSSVASGERSVLASERLTRPLITDADLEFLGAFTLPREACGSSTGYASGCLALRKVNGTTHLFSDSHIYTGGAIYEAEVPQLSKKAPYAEAKLVKEWGDIYQGRKLNAEGKPYVLNENIPTNGLRWDEATKSLWWVYGEKYNTENQAAPTVGVTMLDGEPMKVHGPWRLGLSQLWQRGGTLDIPQWFADAYTDGHRLGVGFGGYYSVFEGGSFGPALTATSFPPSDRRAKFKQLLGYPDPHRCPRDANYHHANPGWMGKDPVNGKGTWNATDEVGGENYGAGAVWIDLPEKHGLLFFASVGQGRLSYEDGAVQAEKRANVLYVYDPADLAKVAQREKKVWEPEPRMYPFKSPAAGLAGRVAGVAFDKASRRLYVVFVQAYSADEEWYPAVMVYHIAR